jgi:hypothetical protein
MLDLSLLLLASLPPRHSRRLIRALQTLFGLESFA